MRFCNISQGGRFLQYGDFCLRIYPTRLERCGPVNAVNLSSGRPFWVDDSEDVGFFIARACPEKTESGRFSEVKPGQEFLSSLFGGGGIALVKLIGEYRLKDPHQGDLADAVLLGSGACLVYVPSDAMVSFAPPEQEAGKTGEQSSVLASLC